MSSRFIYDAGGGLKYRVEDQGTQVLVYDASGTLKYRFDKVSNNTFDARGSLVMRGNILLDLG
jgi:hypothetical protein